MSILFFSNPAMDHAWLVAALIITSIFAAVGNFKFHDYLKNRNRNYEENS